MKLLLTLLFVGLFSICFGQSQADSLIVIENDSLLVYTGILSKDPVFKSNEKGLHIFVHKKSSQNVLEYISNHEISGKVKILLLINDKGLVVNGKVIQGLDPIIDNEYLSILKQSEWEPALNEKNQSVNRYLIIPIKLNVTINK